MVCPYCQNEMTKGYIQCRDGVFWVSKQSLVAALSGLKKGAVKLSNSPDAPSSVSVAYLCRSCKKVIIDINNN